MCDKQSYFHLLSKEQAFRRENSKSLSRSIFHCCVGICFFVILCAFLQKETFVVFSESNMIPTYACPALTLGLRPGFPLLFLLGFLMGFLFALFSGTVTWVSTFTLPPLFLESSSGWMRGRTPPFDIVTPLSNYSIIHQNNGIAIIIIIRTKVKILLLNILLRCIRLISQHGIEVGYWNKGGKFIAFNALPPW